jgi:hypothetical protein
MNLPPSSRADSGPHWLVRLRDYSPNGEESRKAFALERRFFVSNSRRWFLGGGYRPSFFHSAKIGNL